MATLRPALGHAVDQSVPGLPAAYPRTGLSRCIGRGLVLGATATLALTLLPGTAAADPEEATSAAQAAQLVARAAHDLEVVTEQVNEARETLARQQAAAQHADLAAAEAQAQLEALDGHIRQVARAAFTSGTSVEGMEELDLLMISGSAEEFVSRLATLDAIAVHTTEVLGEVAESAAAARQARAEAETAQAAAQRTLDDVTARQTQLESDIADYQAQYDALSVPQRQEVVATRVGQAVVAAPAAAASGAAQIAVDTALAQVGDAYVWGAGGPEAFDCSGLTQYAYAAAGISLPHSSRMQSQMGTAVSRGDLQPGDLTFYYSPISHVSMYTGNGQMVHASTSGQQVKVVSVDSMGGITAMRRIAWSPSSCRTTPRQVASPTCAEPRLASLPHVTASVAARTLLAWTDTDRGGGRVRAAHGKATWRPMARQVNLPGMQPVILSSARRHGIADEDMLHALRNAIGEYPGQGIYDLTIAVGPARNGVTLLEVGYDLADDDRIVIVHAMKAPTEVPLRRDDHDAAKLRGDRRAV
ncbi:C40 family peptidase [Geodermatophilus sp. DF01-2]|uniref:C40 family peptidase n=1 Tax=Geodermatophilus sp. DF01-2 TaxID=2559610 RepID=UPI001FD8245A|nr:C40 family peptidase [Geodermatophilus sp. DF01_2]